MEGKRMYTTKEVAQALGVSDAYIRKLVRQGKAHPQGQFGGTHQFSLEEIERLKSRPKKPGRKPQQS